MVVTWVMRLIVMVIVEVMKDGSDFGRAACGYDNKGMITVVVAEAMVVATMMVMA